MPQNCLEFCWEGDLSPPPCIVPPATFRRHRECPPNPSGLQRRAVCSHPGMMPTQYRGECTEPVGCQCSAGRVISLCQAYGSLNQNRSGIDAAGCSPLTVMPPRWDGFMGFEIVELRFVGEIVPQNCRVFAGKGICHHRPCKVSLSQVSAKPIGRSMASSLQSYQ